MTIKQFIEKAVEGGYVEGPTHKFVTADRYWIVWLDGNGIEYTIATQVSFLDPKFWQAVGKVEGWGFNEKGGCPKCDYDPRSEGWLISTPVQCPECRTSRADWKFYMHRMIDALTEGKTIESFLETL